MKTCLVSVAALTALTALACGAPSTATDAGQNASALFAITFKAKVGAADFACGQTYAVGTPATQYRPRDFRLYLHDVTLRTATGTEVPFALAVDGAFQGDGVALLDFEDAQGDCSNGTAATHDTLTGSAPAGEYATLSFTLGVPFAKNHQDAAAAVAPLNATAMFWSWQGGYKFLKVDGLTTGLGMGHNIHIGSSGCQPGATPNSVSGCDNGNRVRVTLEGFDAARPVLLDLAALVAQSDLDQNQAMSAPGCMSQPTDGDCSPIFARLGLPFAGTAGSPAQQAFFKVK